MVNEFGDVGDMELHTDTLQILEEEGLMEVDVGPGVRRLHVLTAQGRRAAEMWLGLKGLMCPAES